RRWLNWAWTSPCQKRTLPRNRLSHPQRALRTPLRNGRRGVLLYVTSSLGLLDVYDGRVVAYLLAFGYVDGLHGPGEGSLDRRHDLHRLDNDERLIGF